MNASSLLAVSLRMMSFKNCLMLWRVYECFVKGIKLLQEMTLLSVLLLVLVIMSLSSSLLYLLSLIITLSNYDILRVYTVMYYIFFILYQPLCGELLCE